MKGGLFRTVTDRRRGFDKAYPLRRAVLTLGLVGLAYALSSAVLAAAGAVPTVPVIAGMDIDNYYAYQIVFVVPLVFAAWVLSSGVLMAAGTKGCRRRDVLAVASRAWAGPLLLAWVPSGVEAVFAALGMGQAEWVDILSEPGLWQTLYLGTYAAAAAWAVTRFVRTARAVHKRSWPAAAAIGLAAAGVAIGCYILFVR